MWSITRKLMKSSLGRLIPSMIAIWIAAAFVSGAFLFASSINSVISDRQSFDLAKSDYVIQTSSDSSKRILAVKDFPLDKVRNADGVKDVYLPASGHLHLKISGSDRNVVAVKPTSNSNLLPVDLVEGNLPSGENQIVLDKTIAADENLHVGDSIQFVVLVEKTASPDQASNEVSGEASDKEKHPAEGETERALEKHNLETHTLTATVVGLIEDPSGRYSAIGGVTIPSEDIYKKYVEVRESGDQIVEQILLETSGTLTPSQIAAIQSAIPDNYEVKSRAEIQEQRSRDITNTNTAPQEVIILAFGLLAMFVASLVVSNTFQVIIAQRKHTLALIRIIGAKKKQLYRSVIIESSIMSFFASIGGVLTALGLMAIIAALDPFAKYSVHLGLHVTWQSVILPILLVVIVTLLASIAPALAATRVKPIEALQVQRVTESKRIGILRLVTTLLLLAIGGWMIYSSISGTLDNMESGSLIIHGRDDYVVSILNAMGGCFFVGIGLLVGARIWLASVIKIIGKLFVKLGPSARIAQMNVRRNPSRVAATGSALLIGVTLVSCVSTAGFIAKKSFNDLLDSRFSADLVVVGDSLNQSTFDKLTSKYHAKKSLLAPVYRTSYLDGRNDWNSISIVAVPDVKSVTENIRGSFNDVTLDEGQILISKQFLRDRELPSCDFPISTSGYRDQMVGIDEYNHPNPKEVKALPFSCDFSDSETVRLKPVLADFGSLTDTDLTAFVSMSTLDKLGIQTATHIAIIQLDDKELRNGSDIFKKANELFSVSGTQQVFAPVFIRIIWEKVIDILFLFILGMLSISIIIAIIGLMNTLILSILERKREIATLRAIGLRRRQVRRSLIAEAMMMAVTTSVIAMGIGTLFGFLGAYVTLGPILDISFGVDWIVYGAMLGVSVIVSIVASVIPAHKASVVPPVQALQEE